MDWLAGAGWREYFADKGKPWDEYPTAEAFRQRHLADGLTALATILTRRR